MSIIFRRIFLDTNIFIIGDADKESPESLILEAFGYRGKVSSFTAEIIFSDELIDQIRRVAKYLYGKQQAGKILANLWHWLNIYYIPSTIDWKEEELELLKQQIIPSEDIEIYLTAKYGEADCFVSGNRKLLTSIAMFDCLTPEEFIKKYL
ncbi:PIN domain-containing protein [Euhalothece natronophila]|uniref:PIN domain-containing protein n=1 Tax=Euhalothece natronophila TaxID=577489 RepID=UPI0028F41FD5|nr:PIN domain-containing protein [Euhalothece natronophila]